MKIPTGMFLASRFFWFTNNTFCQSSFTLKAKDNTRIYFWKIDFSFKLYRHHRRLLFFKRVKNY